MAGGSGNSGGKYARPVGRGFLVALVIGGLALRLLWLAGVFGAIDVFADAGEATRVALAYARTGAVADAYFVGQGPTAHLMPLNPIIAGTIIARLGAGSLASDLTLLAWSLGQVFAAYLILGRLFARLGADPVAVRWGLALLFLIAPFAPQEMIDFQYWEGGTALLLASINLLAIAHFIDRPSMDWQRMALIAALTALTFFVSPPVGLAIDLCWAVAVIRYLPIRQTIAFAGLCAAGVALLAAPWAVRNATHLGAPVPLRSNFGIELALANHPAAMSGTAPEIVFDQRLREIHPAANQALRPVIVAHGGEVAYSNRLAEQARRWITTHPGDFAILYVRHLRQFFAPEPWQMFFSGWEAFRGPRALTISLVNLLGLARLAIGIGRGRRRYWLPMGYVLAVALPFALFQPMSRYIFVVYAVMAIPAVDMLVTVLSVRRSQADRA